MDFFCHYLIDTVRLLDTLIVLYLIDIFFGELLSLKCRMVNGILGFFPSEWVMCTAVSLNFPKFLECSEAFISKQKVTDEPTDSAL